MLKPEPTERRRVQRLHLLEPLPGKIRGKKVHVLDVSLGGVRVAHGDALGPVGEECELVFEWEGQDVVLDCRIRRSAVQRIGAAAYARTLYHSGLEIRPSGRSLAVLRSMIEAYIERVLEEQRANARGIAASEERAAAPPPTELIRHELVKGMWVSVKSVKAEQPDNGFTIAASHSPTEVQMLRRAYAAGDETAREAIRRIAALTISATAFPPRR
jgi:hypothetical protein